MASGPDLFVVCKSCGSEVSPYITECPYCGTRLRKRAPKLERGGKPKAPKRPRPRLAPLRRGEIPGIRPDRRPYATIALVVASVVVSLLGAAGLNRIGELLLFGPVDGDWWRLVTTQFFYDGTGYEVAALAAIALFGTLLERRHGWWAPPAVFLIGGTAGMAAVAAVETPPFAVGGNAAALALLAAWAMRDVLGRRRGREDDADLLGTLAIAALLVLLPVATREADPLAGLVGGVAGEAQRMVGANAPGLQRILTEALHAADWFGSAHQAAVLDAAGKPDVDERLVAVRTLIAEETGVSMLIGVAVGFELARELMQDEE